MWLLHSAKETFKSKCIICIRTRYSISNVSGVKPAATGPVSLLTCPPRTLPPVSSKLLFVLQKQYFCPIQSNLTIWYFAMWDTCLSGTVFLGTAKTFALHKLLLLYVYDSWLCGTVGMAVECPTYPFDCAWVHIGYTVVVHRGGPPRCTFFIDDKCLRV